MANIGRFEVVEHDGKTYVTQERKAGKGDLAIVLADKSKHYLINGTIREVVGISGNYEYPVRLEDGRESFAWVKHEEYAVLVPLESGAKVTLDDVEYRIDRKHAQACDKVVIIGGNGELYGCGEVFVITGLDDDSDPLIEDNSGNDEMYLDEDEYLVLTPLSNPKSIESEAVEPVETTDIIEHNGKKYRKVEREVREGDEYIVATTDRYSDTTSGKIYAIKEIDSDGDAVYVDNAGDEAFIREGQYAVLEEITLSIDEEIEDTRKKLAELEREKAEESRLKVGEYAVFVRHGFGEFIIGDIVEITTYDGSDVPYQAKRVDDGQYQWCENTQLRRATPEEVAEAKRKLEAERKQREVSEKWAKLGRKVGEIREGDLVAYKKSPAVKVIVVCGNAVIIDQPTVSGNKLTVNKADLTLIAPVESIVNLRVE